MNAKKTTTKKTTKPAAKAEAKKPETKAKPKKEPTAKKASAIDAAARVLAEAKKSLNAREMIESMADRGYWKSPGGQTPHATLYSAILREISAKGKEARFLKTERGKFAINPKA